MVIFFISLCIFFMLYIFIGEKYFIPMNPHDIRIPAINIHTLSRETHAIRSFKKQYLHILEGLSVPCHDTFLEFLASQIADMPIPRDILRYIARHGGTLIWEYPENGLEPATQLRVASVIGALSTRTDVRIVTVSAYIVYRLSNMIRLYGHEDIARKMLFPVTINPADVKAYYVAGEIMEEFPVTENGIEENFFEHVDQLLADETARISMYLERKKKFSAY